MAESVLRGTLPTHNKFGTFYSTRVGSEEIHIHLLSRKKSNVCVRRNLLWREPRQRPMDFKHFACKAHRLQKYIHKSKLIYLNQSTADSDLFISLLLCCTDLFRSDLFLMYWSISDVLIYFDQSTTDSDLNRSVYQKYLYQSTLDQTTTDSDLNRSVYQNSVYYRYWRERERAAESPLKRTPPTPSRFDALLVQHSV